MKKILLTVYMTFIGIFAIATIDTVSVANFSFTPSSLTIDLGDTVRFVWISGTHPTAPDTAADWTTLMMNSGNTVEDLVLTSIGSYPYYCTNHGGVGGSGMSGVINVVTAATPTSITTQPTDESGTEGTLITIEIGSFNATGYQWQVDEGSGFANIVDNTVYNGATNSSMDVNISLTMNGFQYRCLVNGTPDITSDTITLTVNAASSGGPATILIQNFEYVPSTLNVNAGDSIQFKWVEGTHPTESIDATWSTFTLGATDSTFDLVINTDGIYKYFCTAHGSNDGEGNVSGMSGEIIVGTPDGMSDNFNKTFIVGPNPFEDQISIIHNFSNLKKIEVVNVIGSVLTSKNVNEMQNVSLKNLESGMYFVKAYDNNNDLLRTVKIIKK